MRVRIRMHWCEHNGFHLLFIFEIYIISVLIGNIDLNLRPILTFCTQIVQHNAHAIFILAKFIQYTCTMLGIISIKQVINIKSFPEEMTGRAIHRHAKFAVSFCFGIEQGNKKKDRFLKRVSVPNGNNNITTNFQCIFSSRY